MYKYLGTCYLNALIFPRNSEEGTGTEFEFWGENKAEVH